MLSLFSLPVRPGIGPMRRRRPPTTAEERRRRRASEEPGITRPTTTSWNASAATEGSSSTTRTSRRRPGRCTPTRSRPPWEDPSLGWDRMYFFIIFSPGIIVGGGGGGWWMRWNPLASSSHLVSCPLFICIPYRRDQSGRDQKYSNIFHRLGVGFETSAMHLLLQGLSGNWWERVGGANRSRAARKKKEKTVPLCWIELMRGAEILVGLKTCSRSRHTRLSAFGYFHFITSSWWLSFHANISRSFFLFANFSINMRKRMKNWCGENWPIIADVQHRVTGAFVPV